MVVTCQDLAAAKDPNGVGNVAEVNTACKSAFDYCFANIHDDFNASGVGSNSPPSIQYLSNQAYSATSSTSSHPPLPKLPLPNGPPATSTTQKSSKLSAYP
jgi:hypothetical protein